MVPSTTTGAFDAAIADAIGVKSVVSSGYSLYTVLVNPWAVR